MIPLRNVAYSLWVAVLVLIVAGCGKPIPAVVPVSGVITLNGKPLGKAEIRFYPMLEHLDGNYVSSSVSGDDGSFKLSLPNQPDTGCCACLCKVIVSEGPIPEEARRADEVDGDSRGLIMYRNSLKNRPIPANYSRLGTTPLSFEVGESQTEYNIELVR